MQLFYNNKNDSEFILSNDESHHIKKVLRKHEGDILNFTDGEGNLIIGKIISFKKKQAIIQKINNLKKKKSHNYNLHIAISPTKNMDRFEWFLEKATEIGVDEITPMICERSERKVIKIERCNRILISAMKQSLKYHLPKLHETTLFKDIINNSSLNNKYIAHLNNKSIPLKNQSAQNDTTILIGPEGDFSENEIQQAILKEFKLINLGKNRLRTETAGVVAVNTININSNSTG